MSRNYNQKYNEKEDDRINITVEDIEPFTYPSKVGYITGLDLGQRINRMFSKIFADFYASEIVPNQGKVYIYLHFSEPDPTRNDLTLERAFEPIKINKNQAPGIVSLQISNIMYSNRRYKITEYGRDILSQFIFSNSAKDFDPKQLSAEQSIAQIVGGRQVQSVITRCFGFDLNKITRLVMPGVKDDDEVMLTFVRPVNYVNTSTGRYDNKLYRIEIMNATEYKNMGKLYGIGNIQNLNTGNPDLIIGY